MNEEAGEGGEDTLEVNEESLCSYPQRDKKELI